MNLLLSLLLLLTPAPVKTEHGRFNITRDGQNIGADDFNVRRRGANYVFEGKTTIGDMTMMSWMEDTEKLIPVSYEATSTGGTTRLTVGSPTSELQTMVNGEASVEIVDVRMQATVDNDGTLTKLSVPAANVVVER